MTISIVRSRPSTGFALTVKARRISTPFLAVPSCAFLRQSSSETSFRPRTSTGSVAALDAPRGSTPPRIGHPAGGGVRLCQVQPLGEIADRSAGRAPASTARRVPGSVPLAGEPRGTVARLVGRLSRDANALTGELDVIARLEDAEEFRLPDERPAVETHLARHARNPRMTASAHSHFGWGSPGLS